MEKANRIISIILIILAVLLLFFSYKIPIIKTVQEININCQFFPRISSIFLLILSVLLFLKSFKLTEKIKLFSKQSSKEKEVKTVNIKYKIVFSIILLTTIYLVLFFRVGFIVSSIIYILIFLLLMGTRKWYYLIPIPILFPVIIYLLFSYAFNILLP